MFAALSAKGERVFRSLPLSFRIRRALLSAVAVLTLICQSGQAAAQTIIRDSEIERTLSALIGPMLDAADLPRSDVRLFILGERSLNAFVTAENNMFLHTGLLQVLETPEELLGVMAHEAGHIKAKHVVKRIGALEQARTQATLATLLGIAASVAGGGGAGAAIIGGGQNLATRTLLKFTRNQESSADQAALAFLNRANIDPSGMLTVLRRLEKEQGVFQNNLDPYTLTHPLSRARIQALADGVSKSPALGQQVSPDLRYWHTRMRAKLEGFLNSPGASALGSYGAPEFDLYRDAIRLHRLPSPDEAVATIERLIEMRPEDPYYWELKGQILFESGRGPQSIAPYRRALELKPGDALIAGGLGQALLTENSPAANAEALQVLERASLDDPFDARVRRSLAIAYDRAGNPGMSAVASAERLTLLGRIKDAVRLAERAQGLLPTGSPGWRRADDIIALKPTK
ncbi:MAG: M48 family metalloprotease [Rhodobacteraceae bacterium]|nr:M48 family metalloprotease [Paracoccaceae bacterium]